MTPVSEEKFNKILARNLSYQLSKNDMTQVELAEKLNTSTTTIYYWLNGIKTPRMDKVDKMCEIFDIKRSDLFEDHQEDDTYYIDDETSKIAQEIFENKELRLLFDSAKDSSPEDLKAVHDMLLVLKRKEQNDD